MHVHIIHALQVIHRVLFSNPNWLVLAIIYLLLNYRFLTNIYHLDLLDDVTQG